MRDSRGSSSIGKLILVLIVLLFAFIGYSTYYLIKQNAQTATCQSNLHKISQAMSSYINDYNGKLPLLELGFDWSNFYILDTQTFTCPSGETSISYGQNPTLSGLFYKSFENQNPAVFWDGELVLKQTYCAAFETKKPEDIPGLDKTRHESPYGHGCNVCFLDGHVKYSSSFSQELITYNWAFRPPSSTH